MISPGELPVNTTYFPMGYDFAWQAYSYNFWVIFAHLKLWFV